MTMTTDIDTRDRVIRMETELKALKEDVDQMKAQVNDIHTLLTEARGVQKAVRVLIWLSSIGVVTWIVTAFKWLSVKLGIN